MTAVHGGQVQEGGEGVELGPDPILGLGLTQVVTPCELETPLAPLPAPALLINIILPQTNCRYFNVCTQGIIFQ